MKAGNRTHSIYRKSGDGPAEKVGVVVLVPSPRAESGRPVWQASIERGGTTFEGTGNTVLKALNAAVCEVRRAGKP